MKCHREWAQTDNVARSRRWQHQDIRKAPEWLVEMSPLGTLNPIPQIVIVHGSDDWEATWEAFCTRNMPNNWAVVEVERA